MVPGRFRFDRFTLDPANRLLTEGGTPIDLNARYLDALALMVSNPGQLVSKDRFLEDVWGGVPVTDEALTQCVKTLRRVLGDDAANPRLIETVPKHGYRFIAPVESSIEALPERGNAAFNARQFLLIGGAGVIGAGLAGVLVGLFYGFVGASHPLQPGMGAASVLLVLVCLTIVAALIGGIGISFGISAAGFATNRRWPWPMISGALGGLIVGAFAKFSGSTRSTCCSASRPATSRARRKGRCLAARSASARGLANAEMKRDHWRGG